MFSGPMTFELLAAFVLITGPAPQEGDEEKYFHLYPHIRLVGVQLELCIGDEHWFKNKFYPKHDIQWFNRVYHDTLGYPSYKWADNFNYDELRRVHSGARRYLEFLENHLAWVGESNAPKEMFDRIGRARERCQLLMLYENCSIQSDSVHHIRKNLKYLLDKVGPEAFYSGRIPSFIPEEDLP